MIDYHIHLERGPYTLDWLKLFWQQAQMVGISEIGITEHTHRFKEFLPIYEHLWTGENCDPVSAAWIKDHFQYSIVDYLALLHAGKEAGIPLKVGLEVDYFVQSESTIRSLLSCYDLDFTLGSVHFIDKWSFDYDPQAGWPGRNVDQVYMEYITLLGTMVESKLFNVLAHLDVVKVFGHRPQANLQEHWIKLLQGIYQADLAIEVSTAGLRKIVGEIYPQPSILKEASRLGIPITIASDAHRPQDVGDRWQEAVSFAQSVGYHSYSSFTKRRRVEHLFPLF